MIRCIFWTFSIKLSVALRSIDRYDDCVSTSVDEFYLFMKLTLTAVFHSFIQGNLTELCTNCKSSYKSLNDLYGQKEQNQTLCIDLEDAVRKSGIDFCTKIYIFSLKFGVLTESLPCFR